MRCQRAQQRLMAYHDSELSPGAGRRVEKHIESCTECSQLLERLRLADHHASSAVDVNGIVGLPGMPPPEDKYWESFTARVLDRVEEDAATRVPDRHKPRQNWSLAIPRLAPAFSIALVVVVAAGVLMKIGDPIPVPKTPVAHMDSAPEKGVPVADREISHDEPDRGERGYDANTPAEESRQTSAGETRENDDAYRSTPAPEPASPSADVSAEADQAKAETYEVKAEATEDMPEPEQVATLEEVEEGAIVLKKREALAASEVVAQVDGDGMEAAPGPGAKEALLPEAKAEKPPSSVSAKLDGSEVDLVEVDRSAPEMLLNGKLDQTGISRVEAETSQVEDQPSTATKIKDADLDFAEGRDDQLQEKAAVSASAPPVLSVTAGTGTNDKAMATDTASTAATGEEAVSGFTDESMQTMEAPEELGDEVALITPDEPSEESKVVASGMETLGSSESSGEVKRTFTSKSPLYRGPEDQLIHARNLADVRKFWESEKVLKDLLSQRLPTPIQEEASILLVKVLRNQNRTGEAQQVLDDAKVQFPASEMIQTFDLKLEGKGQ